MEVLRTKQPDTRPPSAFILDSYPYQSSQLVLVYTTKDTVTEVTGRLSGGASLVGMDSVSPQHWLLQFGAASRELRMTVADFVEWLGNG